MTSLAELRERFLATSTISMPLAGLIVWSAFDTPEALTARERDVLKLLTSGISNSQIAAALNLGEGTVRNHVSNILSKLGVADRTKAVLVALHKQLV